MLQGAAVRTLKFDSARWNSANQLIPFYIVSRLIKKFLSMRWAILKINLKGLTYTSV
jgi:hypothetical protein